MTAHQKNNHLIDRALHMADIYLMYGDWLKALRYTQLAFWLCRRNYSEWKREIKKTAKY